MAQQNQVTWAQLRVGLFVSFATVLLIVVIFYVTGGSALQAKYRLHTFLPEVDGLTVGAPVRVDGVSVGNVEKIVLADLQPGQRPEKDRSIEIDMRINKHYQDYIRTDSTAGLITEGLLGNRYVDIDRGFIGRPMTNGEELPGRQERALKAVVERSADLMQNLSAITEKANTVLDDIKNGHGSLGKFLVDDQAYKNLNGSLHNIDSIVADVRSGKGTLGKLITEDDVYNHVDSVAGRIDDVLGAVQNKQGTLGKLVYEPEFHDSAKKFIDNGNTFIEGIQAGKGTLGKLATDDSLFNQYRQVGENLSTATAKLNSNETTAGKFFSDPKLYDNLSGLAGDARLLMGDFRKDPKKFLHVKFSLF